MFLPLILLAHFTTPKLIKKLFLLIQSRVNSTNAPKVQCLFQSTAATRGS